jgi:hypothetical protein
LEKKQQHTFIGRRGRTGCELLRDEGTRNYIDALADFENVWILLGSFKELSTKYGVLSAVNVLLV